MVYNDIILCPFEIQNSMLSQSITGVSQTIFMCMSPSKFCSIHFIGILSNQLLVWWPPNTSSSTSWLVSIRGNLPLDLLGLYLNLFIFWKPHFYLSNYTSPLVSLLEVKVLESWRHSPICCFMVKHNTCSQADLTNSLTLNVTSCVTRSSSRVVSPFVMCCCFCIFVECWF